MKICILDLPPRGKGCINKDVNGGFGTATKIGNSLRARLLENTKKNGVQLPLLTLGYAAAILRKNGHSVNYETVPSTEYDLVIIHSTMVDYKQEIEIADKLRKKTKVGIIGPFASAKPDIYKDHADFIIQGESESALMNITDKIPTGIIKSEMIIELDTLPYPDWDGFPIEKYSYYPVIKEKPFIVIQSSRGCIYSCSHYCPYTFSQGVKWRNRSVENVIGEIKMLKEKYGIKGLLFRDPLFTCNKKRVEELAKIMKGMNLRWACETRLDLLDEQLLDLLYESGLRSINVGVESSNESILKDAKRKPVSQVHQEKIISYCDKKGIKISAFFILGLLNDTEESINNTIRYAINLNPHVAQFTINNPIPGTPFHEEMKPLFITEDWEKFDNYTPVFKHKNLSSEQLLKLKEKAFVSYYFRLGYITKYIKRMFLSN